jgi:hypothetical protein
MKIPSASGHAIRAKKDSDIYQSYGAATLLGEHEKVATAIFAAVICFGTMPPPVSGWDAAASVDLPADPPLQYLRGLTAREVGEMLTHLAGAGRCGARVQLGGP